MSVFTKATLEVNSIVPFFSFYNWLISIIQILLKFSNIQTAEPPVCLSWPVLVQPRGFHWGDPRQLAMAGDLLVTVKSGGATGTRWVEVSEAAECPSVPQTAHGREDREGRWWDARQPAALQIGCRCPYFSSQGTKGFLVLFFKEGAWKGGALLTN